MCTALIKLLDNPALSTVEQCRYVKGPHFPAGGPMLNSPTAAYLEAYDAPPGASVSATFEMAAGPDAPATASSAGQVTAGSGVHMVTCSLPLASVPPGDTLVHATIAIDGTAVGTVTRTLRRGGLVP